MFTPKAIEFITLISTNEFFLRKKHYVVTWISSNCLKISTGKYIWAEQVGFVPHTGGYFFPPNQTLLTALHSDLIHYSAAYKEGLENPLT